MRFLRNAGVIAAALVASAALHAPMALAAEEGMAGPSRCPEPIELAEAVSDAKPPVAEAPDEGGAPLAGLDDALSGDPSPDGSSPAHPSAPDASDFGGSVPDGGAEGLDDAFPSQEVAGELSFAEGQEAEGAKGKWVERNGSRYYYVDGAAVKGPQRVEGVWYRFDLSDGHMLTGWQECEGERYYCDPATGAMALRNRYLDGAWYWFDERDGHMLTGSAYLDGHWYRYGADGRMLHGSQWIDGDWYFYDRMAGYMAMGPTCIDGDWYLYDLVDGKMKHGWQWIEGAYHYYDLMDGKLYFGWRVIDGDWYWFDEMTGQGDKAQYHRWMMAAAPGGSGVHLFNGASAGAESLAALEASAQRFADRGYSLGYLVMDIGTGRGVCSNADGAFYSASTVKGPYVASVYRCSLGGDMGAINAWHSTCYNAIAYSSNADYGSLRYRFGSAGFYEWLAYAGVDSVNSSTWYPYYSARELGKMWLQLYSDFSKGEMGSSLSALFSHSTNSAVYYELGGRFEVRTKPGWIFGGGYSSTNDAGIVYSDSGDYLIVVLTTAPSDVGMVQDLVRCLDAVHADFMR